MALDQAIDISLGKRSYSPYTGFAPILKIFGSVILVCLAIAALSNGIFRWLAIAIGVIAAVMLAINIRSRNSAPWRSHHFPLMYLWAGSMGAAQGVGDKSFDFAARFCMHMAFPQLSDSDVERLVKASDVQLFEAMKYFDVINKEKSLDAPEVIEFKNSMSELQAKAPDATRRTILFAMIIDKLEGRVSAGKYILASLKGNAF